MRPERDFPPKFERHNSGNASTGSPNWQYVYEKISLTVYKIIPRVRTGWGKQTFIYQASKDWNNLDNDIKNSKSLSSFKAKLKTL